MGGGEKSVSFAVERGGRGNLFAKRESIIMQLCVSYMHCRRDSY